MVAEHSTRVTLLRARLDAHKGEPAKLHDDLKKFASEELDGANAERLKGAVDAHVAANETFHDSALACVPPTR